MVLLGAVTSDPQPSTWGAVWDYSEGLLIHRKTGYEVDLRECVDSAHVLDWVMQVNAKIWADDETMATLLDAIDHYLAPQKTICGGGVHKVIDSQRLKQRLSC